MSGRDAHIEAAAKAWWAHEPEAFDRLPAQFRELQMTRARAALAAADAVRGQERCPFCDHEWSRHDPEDGMCDAPAKAQIGPCPCGRKLPWMQDCIAMLSREALGREDSGCIPYWEAKYNRCTNEARIAIEAAEAALDRIEAALARPSTAERWQELYEVSEDEKAALREALEGAESALRDLSEGEIGDYPIEQHHVEEIAGPALERIDAARSSTAPQEREDAGE